MATALCSTFSRGIAFRPASSRVQRRTAVQVRAAKQAHYEVHFASKSTDSPIVLPSGSDLREKTLQEAMAFTSPAPELINGRLAMVGMVLGLKTEFDGGASIAGQFGSSPFFVLLVVAALAYGSVTPIMKGANVAESFGPFSLQAEKVNGRAAMIGMAFLLLIEAAKGSALF